MKRSWWSVALVAGCVLCLGLLSGCGGGAGGSPEKTVSNYFKAIKNEDLDAMLKCMAPDAREMFEKMVDIQGRENFEKSMFDEKLEKFEVKDVKITGDTAEVKVATTVKGETKEETVPLSKIDGRWFFDIPKEAKKEMKEGLEMMKKMKEGLKEGMPKNLPIPQE